jgi:GMP synthase-like glutamine amidotransferase
MRHQTDQLGPMEEILVFQHDPFEDLGVFAEVLERQAAGYQVIRLFDGETPTEDWERIKGLIVLGGPMSVEDEASIRSYAGKSESFMPRSTRECRFWEFV